MVQRTEGVEHQFSIVATQDSISRFSVSTEEDCYQKQLSSVMGYTSLHITNLFEAASTKKTPKNIKTRDRLREGFIWINMYH